LNESPPAKVSISSTTFFTEQLAGALVLNSSPSTNSLSSVRLMMLAKSWWYSEPSTPLHVPRQAISVFLHCTRSSVQPYAWPAKSWMPRPAFV